MIGDLTFAFDKVSNAETGENGYIYKVKHKIVFAEDLIYNLTHPYLREYTPNDGVDEIDNWVAGLNVLKSNFSDYNHLFVGHNGSRSDVGKVIEENIEYLQNAQGTINGTKTISGGGTATTQKKLWMSSNPYIQAIIQEDFSCPCQMLSSTVIREPLGSNQLLNLIKFKL
ncbi:MAG: hypothetical protein IPL46_26785 [Saprospiraceae bacterium]|nr:hypothetical protein [Saprospiraceae bacterium]